MSRKPKNIKDVELDGLASDAIGLASSVLPPNFLSSNKLVRWFGKVATRLNPCHADEDSKAWRFMVYLFPDCWCCAGLRGVVYGILLTLLGVLLYVH